MKEYEPQNAPTGPVIRVNGVRLRAYGSDQTTEQEVPGHPVERGAEIHERNIVHPEEGSFRAVTDYAGLSDMQRLAKQEQPARFTTHEGSVPRCMVESAERSQNNGTVDDKIEVDITWTQVNIAEVSESNISAVTADGTKSPSAGNASAANGGEQSHVGGGQSASNATAGGQGPFARGRAAGRAATQDTLGGIGKDVSNAATKNQSGGGS